MEFNCSLNADRENKTFLIFPLSFADYELNGYSQIQNKNKDKSETLFQKALIGLIRAIKHILNENCSKVLVFVLATKGKLEIGRRIIESLNNMEINAISKVVQIEKTNHMLDKNEVKANLCNILISERNPECSDKLCVYIHQSKILDPSNLINFHGKYPLDLFLLKTKSFGENGAVKCKILKKDLEEIRYKSLNEVSLETNKVVEAMKLYIKDFKNSQKGKTEIKSFWVRKSKRVVLGILLTSKNNKEYKITRGINLEVSLPTGATCAERNAISTALSEDCNLFRKDCKMIAICEISFGKENKDTNPLTPCGVCREWLLKLSDQNPMFRVISFKSESCDLIHERFVNN